MSSRPTIVLVPGAFHLPFTMDLLSHHLQRAGYPTRIKGQVTVNQHSTITPRGRHGSSKRSPIPLDPQARQRRRSLSAILCWLPRSRCHQGAVKSRATRRREAGRHSRLDIPVGICASRGTGSIRNDRGLTCSMAKARCTISFSFSCSQTWSLELACHTSDISKQLDKGLGYVTDPKQVFYSDVPEPLAAEIAKQGGGQSLKSLSRASGKVYYGDPAYDGRRAYIHTSKDQAIRNLGGEREAENEADREACGEGR